LKSTSFQGKRFHETSARRSNDHPDWLFSMMTPFIDARTQAR